VWWIATLWMDEPGAAAALAPADGNAPGASGTPENADALTPPNSHGTSAGLPLG